MSIGEKIINLREKRDWSQRELARRVDLNASVMNRIESGDRPVKDHELTKIANVLDVDSDYLLGRSELPKRKAEKEFDSLAALKEIVDDLGIEDLFFHNMDDLKDLTPEDVEEIRNHFEYVTHKAKKRKNKADK